MIFAALSAIFRFLSALAYMALSYMAVVAAIVCLVVVFIPKFQFEDRMAAGVLAVLFWSTFISFKLQGALIFHELNQIDTSKMEVDDDDC